MSREFTIHPDALARMKMLMHLQAKASQKRRPSNRQHEERPIAVAPNAGVAKRKCHCESNSASDSNA